MVKQISNKKNQVSKLGLLSRLSYLHCEYLSNENWVGIHGIAKDNTSTDLNC